MLTPRTIPTGDSATASKPEFDLPEVIADHVLLRCIGEGSYGRVFLAQNQLTGVYRALKVVFRESFRDARPYLREFEAICSFEPISRCHQGFVQILHVGQLENAFYYIMEIGDDPVSGATIHPENYSPRTLGLNRGQMLPIEQCIQIGSSLADTLSVLHEKHLIHRDIKPSNIIFVAGQPKLADIGLVTQIDEAKSFVGTAGFMPPEGPVAPGSDIYSLGKVLYEIATGKDRCEFPELPGHITTDHALHLELNQILLRACHPKPDKRYRTAQELRRELELLHAGKSIKRLRQVEKRLRFFKIALAASLLTGIIGFFIYSQIETRRQEVERERQRQAGYFLAEGTSEMRDGNLGRALPYFIRAAEFDPRDMQSHQLRIGSVVSQAPQRLRAWKSATGGEFSADGLWLVVPDGSEIRIFESTTGRLIESIPLDGRVTLARVSPDRSIVAAAVGSRLIVLRRGGDQQRVEHEFNGEIWNFAFSPRDGRIAVSHSNGSASFFDPETGAVQPFPGEAKVAGISFNNDGQWMFTAHEHSDASHLRSGTSGQIVGRTLSTDLPYRGVFSPDSRIIIVCGWNSAVPFKVTSGELAGDKMNNDDAVVHAAFSPDTNLLATANYDGTVRLWDAKSFDPLPLNHIIEHGSRPRRLAFIDKSTLVVHCMGGSNYVWSLGARKPEAIPIPFEKKAEMLKVTAPGIQLAARGSEISGTIENRDIHVLFPTSVTVLAASPLKTAFAAGSKDSEFAMTYALLYLLSDLDAPIPLNHNDGINHIAFSHAGDKVVTSSEDFSAIIWDARTGQQISKAMRHRWQVTWACFSPDDKWLVTAGWDRMCIVWDATTGEPLTAPLEFPVSLDYVGFEPETRGIITRGRATWRATNSYRMSLPFASLPLSQYTNGLSAFFGPMREPR